MVLTSAGENLHSGLKSPNGVSTRSIEDAAQTHRRAPTAATVKERRDMVKVKSVAWRLAEGPNG